MNEFTPEQRLEFYKKMLKIMKKDRRLARRTNDILCGICYATMKVISYECELIDLPEIWEQKPKMLYNEYYWFARNPENTQRIEVIKNAIVKVKELIR